MPFIGMSAEYIDKEVSNNFERTLSGGSAVYGTGGLLLNFDNLVSIFIKGDMPVVQNYKSPDGNVYNNLRAQIQLSYFFRTKTKISKTLKIK